MVACGKFNTGMIYTTRLASHFLSKRRAHPLVWMWSWLLEEGEISNQNNDEDVIYNDETKNLTYWGNDVF